MGAIVANRMLFAASADIYLTLRADYGSGRVRRAFRRCGYRIDCFCKQGCRRRGALMKICSCMRAAKSNRQYNDV